MLDNFLNLSGKHSKSSKPKNSKKGESQEPEQPAKKSYRIPRVNKLLETDSDDDSLGLLECGYIYPLHQFWNKHKHLF